MPHLDISGVIVKYHPCSRHARGTPCPYFRVRGGCKEAHLECTMPQYDKWYKDVLTGKVKCFYPNKIRLLENPGVPMFLYHVHHHAIMGEATVVRSTVKDGKHFYCFDEFLSYPHPVQLELLMTDPRLPKLARRGQWLFLYIGKQAIEEIRGLSKLSEEERRRLGIDLEQAIKRLKRPYSFELHRPAWEIRIREEYEKLEKDYKINEQILNETRQYFDKLIQMKLHIGRSTNEIFYASLYLGFRMSQIPILIDDITRISGIDSKKLGKLYRLLVKELKLTVPLVDPKQLIKSRSDKLDISETTIERAISIVQEAERRGITIGKAPSSVAAGAIFVACEEEGEDIGQDLIAKVFDVSPLTIRNQSHKLKAL